MRQRKETYLGCAEGFLLLGRPRDAIREIDEMEEIIGFCNHGFEIKLFALGNLGDLSGLIAYCTKVLFEMDLDHGPAWAALIEGYHLQGRLDSAIKESGRALMRFPMDSDINYQAARLRAALGDLPMAAELVMRSIGEDLDKRRWLSSDDGFIKLRIYLKRGGS